MKRWRRWFIVVPAAIAALVLVLMLALQLGPVRARVLASVAARLRATYGVELSAERLDYGPFSLSARLKKIRLAKAAGPGSAGPGSATPSAPFFEADELRVALPWLAVAGTFAIDSVELIRPRLAIVRNENGVLNLPQTSGALDRVPIGAIRLDHGDASFVDRQGGYSVEARDLSVWLRPLGPGACAGPVSVASLLVKRGGRGTLTAKLTGGVSYDGANVSLERMRMTAQEGEVQLDGSIASIYGSLGANLTYRVALDLRRLASLMSVASAPSGRLTVSGHVAGSLSDPQLTAALKADGLSWAGLKGVSLEGDASATIDKAELRSLHVTSPYGRAAAAGALDLSGKTGGRFHAEWNDVAIAGLLSAVGPSTKGLVAGRLDGKADVTWLEPKLERVEVQLESTTSAPAAPPSGTMPLEGWARLRLSNGAYKFEQEHGVAGVIQITSSADGRLDISAPGESELRGTASVTSDDLGSAVRRLGGAAGLDAAAFDRLEPGGRAHAELRLSGTLAAPSIAGPIAVTGVRIAGAPEATLSATLNATSFEAHVDSIEVLIGNSRIRGSVIASPSRKAFAGELSGEFPAIEDLLFAIPARWRPTGKASFAARLGGTFSAPRIDSTIAATDLAAAGQRLGSARSNVRFDGKTLTVESAELTQPGGGKLTASATYRLDNQQYSIDVDGKALAVTPIPADDAGAGALAVDALVNVRFAGSGSIAQPSGKGTLELSRFAWNGVEARAGRAEVSLDRGAAVVEVQPFEVTSGTGTVALAQPAKLAYRDGEFSADGIALHAAGTSITASGRLSHGATTGRLDVVVDGDVQDIIPFVPAAKAIAGLEASGAFNLKLSATGTLDRPDITGDFRFDNGRLAANGLPPAISLGVAATYRAGVLELTSLRGIWQGAVLTGSGRVPAWLAAEWLPNRVLSLLPDGDRRARFTARAQPITRAALEPFVPADMLGMIDLSAGVSISLQADRPAIDSLSGELVLDPLSLSLSRVPIAQERPTRLTIAGGKLTVADWSWTGSGTQLAIGGFANLVDRQVDLTARGKSDLRVLSAFLPAGATTGTAELDVRVSGRADDPILDGHITFSGVEARLAQPRFAITELAGTIDLARDQITVRDMHGSANGGRFTVGGTVAHGGMALKGGTLTLSGRGVAFDAPEGMRTESDADLHLEVRPDATMLVSGKVTIQRGAYRSPIVLSGRVLDLLRSGNYAPSAFGYPALDRIRLDVAVVTATDLLVNNNYGQFRIGLDLRLGGTVTRPAVAGRATLGEGGQLFFGGNTYRIQRGTIDFVDASGIKPDLNFTADTRIGSRDITLAVTGTPDRLKTDLSSSDSLGQADIVSLLVTGRTMAETGVEQTSAARDQALQLLSGDLLGFAGRTIGVDTLRLTRGQPVDAFTTDPSLAASETDPAARVTVSKSLSRNVEIILSQSLRQSGGLTWVAIYRPIRSLELRGVSFDDGTRAYEAFHQVTIGGGAAATARPRPRALRVAEVKFTGSPGFAEREIRSKLSVRDGSSFDFFKWQTDRDRLQSLYIDGGYFEARVAASRQDMGNGRVNLVYDVTRGPKTVLVVDGFNLPGVVRNQLRQRWVDTVFDGFLLADLQDVVKTALARDGYLRAVVHALVERSGAGADEQKTIVVHVTPGLPSPTRRVEFRGNTRISSNSLQSILSLQGLELAPWLDPAAVQSAIVSRYRSDGMLNAKVRVERPQFDGPESTVPILIDEGPLFTVSALRVEGSHALSDEAFRKAFSIAGGSPYEPARIDEGRDRVLQAYHRLGFAEARVNVAAELSREKPEVALAMAVQEGPQHVLEGVDVEGGSGTRRAVVDRALRAKPGEPIDPESWYQARRRLYDTGVFKGADIAFAPAGEATAVNGATRQMVRAKVTLQEWPSWRLRYGFKLDDRAAATGTGRDFSPGVMVDLQRPNLFGRAIGLGLNGSYQSTVKLARGTLTLPRVAWLPVTTNIYLTRLRQTMNAEGAVPFVVDKSIVSAEQAFKPFSAVKVTYGYRFERDHTFDPKADPADPLALDFTVNIARLNAAVVLDTRTDPFNPTRGWFHSSNFEYATKGLGSDLRFVKYLAQQFFFHEVGSVTLASAVRFGAGHGIGQDLIPSERFYAGGGTTVRGYGQDELGPIDFFGDARGGDAMLILNQEVRVPVFSWVQAVGFADAGNVFSKVGDVSLDGLKVGLGLGVRLNTPVALVRLDFGVPLSRLPGAPRSRWYFSFGQTF